MEGKVRDGNFSLPDGPERDGSTAFQHFLLCTTTTSLPCHIENLYDRSVSCLVPDHKKQMYYTGCP